MWGSNLQASDYETDALPITSTRLRSCVSWLKSDLTIAIVTWFFSRLPDFSQHGSLSPCDMFNGEPIHSCWHFIIDCLTQQLMKLFNIFKTSTSILALELKVSCHLSSLLLLVTQITIASNTFYILDSLILWLWLLT